MEARIEYIDDVLLNVDNGNIAKKADSQILPIALLLIGAMVLYFGTSKMADNDMISSVILIIGLGLVAYGILAFFMKKEKFMYKPTGKALKKQKVYISPNQSSKLYSILEDKKLDEIGTLSKTNQSNLSLEAYYNADAEYVILQVLEFVPYNDIPRTPTMLFTGREAKQIIDFLK